MRAKKKKKDSTELLYVLNTEYINCMAKDFSVLLFS